MDGSWCHNINYIRNYLAPYLYKVVISELSAQIERIPIRRISFTTPPDRRAPLLESEGAVLWFSGRACQ